jgi:hypothetical protein
MIPRNFCSHTLCLRINWNYFLILCGALVVGITIYLLSFSEVLFVHICFVVVVVQQLLAMSFPLDETDAIPTDLPDLQHFFDKTSLLHINNIIYYISGFVARRAMQSLSCLTCSSLLTDDSRVANCDMLLKIKDLGGLVTPSKDLVTLLTFCESCVRSKFSFHATNMSVMTKFGRIGHLFSDGLCHFMDTSFGIQCHYYDLIRFTSQLYFNIRMHHAAKQDTLALSTKSNRQRLNKVVLFSDL